MKLGSENVIMCEKDGSAGVSHSQARKWLLLDFQHCYIEIVSFIVETSRVFSILCVPVRLLSVFGVLISIVRSHNSVFILVNFPDSSPGVFAIIHAHHFPVVILRLLRLNGLFRLLDFFAPVRGICIYTARCHIV